MPFDLLKEEGADKFEDLDDETKAIVASYKMTFKGKHGARVLKHLRKYYYDPTIMPSDHANFELGCRHVVRKILDLIELAE